MNSRGCHSIINYSDCPFSSQLNSRYCKPNLLLKQQTLHHILSVSAPPAAETPSSDSTPSGGESIPNLSQPSQASEENSNGSLGVSRVPEPPDLADKSSQSSMASLEDAGVTSGEGGNDFEFYFHLNSFVPINEAARSRNGMTAHFSTFRHCHSHSQ